MIAILLALLAVVNSPVDSSTYACNGVQATFTVGFPYQTYADLKVTSTTAGNVVTTLVYTTDFTVNLTSTASTAILTLNAPASSCPNTNTLKIWRGNLTLTQPYGFTGQTTYNPQLHEKAYDRIEMQVQNLNDAISTPAASGTVNVTAPITGNGSVGAPLAIAKSTTAVDGYLAATDWTTFNNKATTKTCSANQFVTVIGSASGTCAQPSSTNLSDGPFVQLQAATPGTPQTGNANLTGTIISTGANGGGGTSGNAGLKGVGGGPGSVTAGDGVNGLGGTGSGALAGGIGGNFQGGSPGSGLAGPGSQSVAGNSLGASVGPQGAVNVGGNTATCSVGTCALAGDGTNSTGGNGGNATAANTGGPAGPGLRGAGGTAGTGNVTGTGGTGGAGAVLTGTSGGSTSGAGTGGTGGAGATGQGGTGGSTVAGAGGNGGAGYSGTGGASGTGASTGIGGAGLIGQGGAGATGTGGAGLVATNGVASGGGTPGNAITATANAGGSGTATGYPLQLAQNGTVKAHIGMNCLTNDPSSPSNGDLWCKTSGGFGNMNGGAVTHFLTTGTNSSDGNAINIATSAVAGGITFTTTPATSKAGVKIGATRLTSRTSSVAVPDCSGAGLALTVTQFLDAGAATCGTAQTITLPSWQTATGTVQNLPGQGGAAVGDEVYFDIYSTAAVILTIACGTGGTCAGGTSIPANTMHHLVCKITAVTANSETATCY